MSKIINNDLLDDLIEKINRSKARNVDCILYYFLNDTDDCDGFVCSDCLKSSLLKALNDIKEEFGEK